MGNGSAASAADRSSAGYRSTFVLTGLLSNRVGVAAKDAPWCEEVRLGTVRWNPFSRTRL
ncbi:hypothetical protein RFN25_00150 [Mesorhizobium abyssinicae]|nr:hypothetical protein [Mesorhizobium abyssinicae]